MTTTTVIDSPHNQYVAAARALSTRKGRAAAGACLVEGPHAVGAVLEAAGDRVSEVFITSDLAAREPNLLRSARPATVVRVVSDRVLAALGETVRPQGVVAVVTTPAPAVDEVLRAGTRLAVLLDRVADPGNAGTVIRTADAAGADAVLLSAGSVDVWSAKVLRSTVGSAFHLPIVTGVASSSAVAAARAEGVQVLSTAADGATSLDDLIDSDALATPTLWLFGNEAHGLPPELSAMATATVRLAIYGRAESLNVAATAAICLYASARAQAGARPAAGRYARAAKR
ncbi:MAG TPA: RNA methyltransferase [Mycobacteriales bacterium]|nr:RNA methyltransferase [Mycobacteriales bacterium]